ncbi:MAG: glycosyltransferase family 2 protein [Candidatus Altiarchaeota archaeon]
MESAPELSVVIPSYNEEETLPRTVPELTGILDREGVSYELVIVNNGSRDGTGRVIDALASRHKGIVRVDVPVNVGWGDGVIKGCAKAAGTYVAYMCADSQVPNENLLKGLNAIRREPDALIKVRRVVRDDGFKRLLSTLSYNFLVNVLFFGISSDVNGTPKMMSRRLWERLQPRYGDFFIDTEVMVKAKGMGVKVVEIPTKSEKRKGGKSSIKLVRDSLGLFRELVEYRFGMRRF